ncbi:caspase family protein [Actinoplanes sp. NPDC020271]|uniref:caspase, EACC1-associated type n=1 Tax=Actinoplanes sp. NPDC020271 TaxID=3363896 RepID=UPI003796F654
MHVPQRDRSNLVIIGSSRYNDDDLCELPGVRNNVRDLGLLLTDPTHGIVADDRYEVVPEATEPHDAIKVLREHAEAARDTLVVYFAGHGLRGDDNRLYLAMRGTVKSDPQLSGLAFDLFHETVHHNQAQNTVVILDCCYSGLAVNGRVDGNSYLLTATQSNRKAVAPAGRTHTAFSGELIKLLRDGVHQGPELLSAQFLFERLQTAMRAGGFPAPANRMTGTGVGIVLSRNRWTGSAGGSADRRSATAVRGPHLDPKPRVSPSGPRRTAPKPVTVPATGASAAIKPARVATPAAARVAANKPAVTAAPATKMAANKPAVTAAPVRGPAAAKAGTRYGPLPRPVFSPDGATLIVAGRNGRIEIWDVATRRLRLTISKGVGNHAIGVGGTMLATTERDRTVRVWGLPSGRPTARLETTGRCLALHQSEPFLLNIGREPVAEIWDVRTSRRTRTLRGHDGAIRRGGFSPDGGWVLTTGQDRTLRVWDARTGRQLSVLTGAHSPRQVAFHTGAGWAATTLASGGVRLRSLTTGEKLTDLRDEAIPTEILAGRDGRTLATLTEDGRVRVFDIRLGRTLLDRHDPPVSRILYGPGQSLMTLTDDGVARLYDIRTGCVRRTIRDSLRAPCWLTFDHSGTHAALGRRDRTVHLYDLRSGNGPEPLQTSSRPELPADDFLRAVYERLRT